MKLKTNNHQTTKLFGSRQKKENHLIGHVLNIKVVTLEGQVAGYLFDSLYLKVLNIFCILIKLRRF
jgi:hypothetical protein